jgi:signal transduction histidine kinase
MVGLAPAGTIASAIPLALAIHSVGGHHRYLIAIFGPIIGGAFIGTGLLAWVRQPDNRFGALMVALGFAYCLSGLIVSTESWSFILGLHLIPLPYAILLHILVAFPTGRLHNRAERVLVGAGYLTATVVWWAVMLIEDTSRLGLPANHLLVADKANLFDTLANARLGLVVVLIVLTGVVLVRRWAEASRAQRRALAPVYVSGGVVLLLYAVWSIIGIAGAAENVQENLERARVVALATVPFAFLAGLLRSRVVGAAAVSALVATLGDGGEPRGRLRDALAQALGDPSLELAFWLDERGGWVDAAGVPVQLPEDGTARTSTVIEHDGRLLATIVHDFSLAEEGDLVRAVGGAASLALENERLDAELRANLHELRASRARIVESADAARRRIERDLHDGAQQQLVAILLALRVARSRIDADPRAAGDMLEAATRDLGGAIGQLRELARGIHPAILSDRGLGAALAALADRMPLQVQVASTPQQRLPASIEAAVYFVVSEALTNVSRYAQATEVRIEVTSDDGEVVAAVADNGVGGADAAKGSGLRGLTDRVAALDGRLEVESDAGLGTTVRAVIPAPHHPLSSRAGPAGQGPAGFAADHPGDPPRPAARPSPRGTRADPS